MLVSCRIPGASECPLVGVHHLHHLSKCRTLAGSADTVRMCRKRYFFFFFGVAYVATCAVVSDLQTQRRLCCKSVVTAACQARGSQPLIVLVDCSCSENLLILRAVPEFKGLSVVLKDIP